MKSQIKSADRSGALVALIVGAQEVAEGTVGLRPLRSGEEQRTRAPGRHRGRAQELPRQRGLRRGAGDDVDRHLHPHDPTTEPDDRTPTRHRHAMTDADTSEPAHRHAHPPLRGAAQGRRRRRPCACAAGWPGAASTASTSPSSTCATTPGIVQCVIDHATDVRSEWVIAVTGTVRERPEGTVNPGIGTGEVEIGDCTVEVLNEAEPPPFSVDDRAEADEPVRLRYRYVDLRRPRMQRNLRLRARVNAAIRAAMDRQGFVEIETPLLWAPTPEGSREFSVPSRLHHGSFYALPQSPQLAKQLLMVGGFDRYYQIARCLRDEDLRADRQFEFTQLDMECSFASQDDVMAFVSEAVLDAAEAATGERPPPIERMTWAEALDRYGTDKPDLRFGMELVDLTEVFEGTEVKAFSVAGRQGDRGPRRRRPTRGRGSTSSPNRRRSAGRGGPGLVPASVENGPVARRAPGAPPVRSRKTVRVLEQTGAEPGDLILAVADELRDGVHGARHAARRPSGRPRWARARIDTSGSSTSRCSRASAPTATRRRPTTRSPCRTPRTCPCWRRDPLAVRSQAYDLVLNGWELGSGSVRIHRRRHPGAGVRRARDRARGGRGPLRVPARRLPLRRAAARRVRRRGRPAGGDPGRRGEHPRGHRVPEDPVGRRPADRRPDAAARRPAWPSWASGSWCRRPAADRRRSGAADRDAGREPLRRRRRPPPAAPGAAGRPAAPPHARRDRGPGAPGRPRRARCASWPSPTGSARRSCGARPAPARPRWPGCWPTPPPST